MLDQIELSMRKDTVWDRPSWPLKGNPSKVMDQIRSILDPMIIVFLKKIRKLGIF